MIALFTLLALIGFAANSILCRLALRPGAIDPASFTAMRLASGAVALALVAAIAARREAPDPHTGFWKSASLLFFYALPFSFAYVTLGVATGALILFLSVQATMVAGALVSGERIHWLEGLGIVAALAGFVYLVSPGLTAPDPVGASLMVVAGIAWGLYSLAGRRSTHPLRDTASNFARSVPFAVVALGVVGWMATANAARSVHVSAQGVFLATASGVLASAGGYALWFAALRKLRTIQAAVLQLTVPVIAALGGLLLGERISARLVLAALLILGGVGLAIGGRSLRSRSSPTPALRVR